MGRKKQLLACFHCCWRAQTTHCKGKMAGSQAGVKKEKCKDKRTPGPARQKTQLIIVSKQQIKAKSQLSLMSSQTKLLREKRPKVWPLRQSLIHSRYLLEKELGAQLLAHRDMNWNKTDKKAAMFLRKLYCHRELLVVMKGILTSLSKGTSFSTHYLSSRFSQIFYCNAPIPSILVSCNHLPPLRPDQKQMPCSFRFLRCKLMLPSWYQILYQLV